MSRRAQLEAQWQRVVTRHADKPTLLSVTNGRDTIGFVLSRGREGYEAFDASERSLGVFASMRDAANRVSDEVVP
jgi:hypothetical protein